MLSARRIRQVPVRCRCPDGWARWANIPNSPVLSPSPRSKGRPPRSRRLRSPNFVSAEIRSLSSAASGGSALILNSCVAAGSLKLGMSYSPLSILQAQLGLGRAARTRPSARQDYATWGTGSGHPACRSSGQAACSPGARKALRYRNCSPPDRWAGPGCLVQPGDRRARPFRCPGRKTVAGRR